MLQIIKFTTKSCKDITYFGIRNHPWFTFRFLYMLYFMKEQMLTIQITLVYYRMLSVG